VFRLVGFGSIVFGSSQSLRSSFELLGLGRFLFFRTSFFESPVTALLACETAMAANLFGLLRLLLLLADCNGRL